MHPDFPQSHFEQQDQLASQGNKLDDYSLTNHSIHLNGPTIARLSQSDNLFLTRQERKQMGLCSQCVGSAGTKTTQWSTLYPDTSHISRQRSSHLTGESMYGESVTGIPNDGAFPLHTRRVHLEQSLLFEMKVPIKPPNSDSGVSCQLHSCFSYLEHVILMLSTFRHGEFEQLYLWSSLFLCVFKPKSIFGE